MSDICVSRSLTEQADKKHEATHKQLQIREKKKSNTKKVESK